MQPRQFLLQATVDPTVEDSSEEQDRQLAETDAAQPKGTEAVGKHSEAEEEEEEALPAGYISRRTTDPYMQKKLRGIQVITLLLHLECSTLSISIDLHLCSDADAMHLLPCMELYSGHHVHDKPKLCDCSAHHNHVCIIQLCLLKVAHLASEQILWTYHNHGSHSH